MTMGRWTLSLEERFWAKVDKTGDCWEWTAALNNRGYGRFRMPDGHVTAHVMSFRLTYGPVPTGKEVHHICENRKCVRPTHLQAVTHRENLLASGTLPGINAKKTHCLNNHPFNEENTAMTKAGKRRCRTCVRERARLRRQRERLGNIGDNPQEIEFEPMPLDVPEPEHVPEEVPV
jgi:hypothetical protein